MWHHRPRRRPPRRPAHPTRAPASAPTSIPRIIASYGGEFRDAKTERLVARIVGALTLVSENPSRPTASPFSIRPRSTPLRLPGGYLYVTRGLLALANDASEVAAVLSHEMAHVTANHGLERQRREQEVELAGQVAEELFSNSIAAGRWLPAANSRSQPFRATRNCRPMSSA
jgi:predicted Zn-dependent protease